jgi:DNA-binding MarR family transcriptional regulator
LSSKEKDLNLNNRKKIYDFISKYPGLNLIKISRELSIPKSTLEYHLKFLIKQGEISSFPNGNYTRFYVSNYLGHREKNVLNLLQEEIPRKIILLILLYPEHFSQINLGKCLKINQSTVKYHIDKLIELGLIEKIEMDYTNIADNNPNSRYRNRFNSMFIVPVKHSKKEEKYIFKTRKKIIRKINIRYNFNRRPNGYEDIYKIKNLGELWYFLVKFRNCFKDKQLNSILKWSDAWQDGLTDFFIKTVDDIFPGLSTGFFP